MADSKHKTRVSPVRRFWRSPLLAPLNQAQAWDRLASVVNPAWSVSEPRARVQRVVEEAPGVRSLWLKPNARFGRFQPGQHVLLELEPGGARQGRCFSLSAAPRRDGLVRLTIKRKPGGPVSAAVHALRPGDVVRLGCAQGDFAPRTGDGPLLLVAAGSGITPMLSILHGLADAGSGRTITLVQCARTVGDQLFTDELRELASRLPSLRLLAHTSQDDGRFGAQHLAVLVPDWSASETLLCGPDGFMATVEAMYTSAGRQALLQAESFGRRAAPVDPDAASHSVLASGGAFAVATGQSLLDGAEAAGLTPRFGCRRGICRSCQCLKRSGTVLNQLTGQESGPGEELIQLCISTPRSAIELAI